MAREANDGVSAHTQEVCFFWQIWAKKHEIGEMERVRFDTIKALPKRNPDRRRGMRHKKHLGSSVEHGRKRGFMICLAPMAKM